jgi:hypothetical protein
VIAERVRKRNKAELKEKRIQLINNSNKTSDENYRQSCDITPKQTSNHFSNPHKMTRVKSQSSPSSNQSAQQHQQHHKPQTSILTTKPDDFPFRI